MNKRISAMFVLTAEVCPNDIFISDKKDDFSLPKTGPYELAQQH